ncbi:glycosyltransferase family 2 protein [Spirosoma aerolatum]|uniref:glycosyltransferase family 2 protein n=1 Tax=Spirosoma aerolatum TaxID=1211326 RepID=UPI0009AC1796|nr:glycosyltransferase [Spirosoma aerolatum]
MQSASRDLLEIFIITYNRSAHLNNTLRQLIGCPFVQFSITILDNCSDDNTYEIYQRYANKFPGLYYIKNKINIGGDANVLRAAELSNGLYTWILCDDDNFDFSVCDDVLDELAKDEVAAIMVGWAAGFTWPEGGMHDTPANLLKRDFPYFSVPTFVPGSIFKTDLLQEQIRISYTNIVNLLPVMTYYVKLYEEGHPIYVSRNKIVSAEGHAGYHHSYLRVMVATCNTFYLIKDSTQRRNAFYRSYFTGQKYMVLQHALFWFELRKLYSFSDKWRYFNILRFKERLLFLGAYCMAPIIKNVKLSDKTAAKIKSLIKGV